MLRGRYLQQRTLPWYDAPGPKLMLLPTQRASSSLHLQFRVIGDCQHVKERRRKWYIFHVCVEEGTGHENFLAQRWVIFDSKEKRFSNVCGSEIHGSPFLSTASQMLTTAVKGPTLPWQHAFVQDCTRGWTIAVGAAH